jgi:hypothetical protein
MPFHFFKIGQKIGQTLQRIFSRYALERMKRKGPLVRAALILGAGEGAGAAED